jgi:hypothetical protein
MASSLFDSTTWLVYGAFAGEAERSQFLHWMARLPTSSSPDALPAWLDYYNLERAHRGIRGQKPIDCVDNGRGEYD